MTGITSLAIEVEALSKTYTRHKSAPVRAVDSLSLRVPAGQVLGFLGPNGAGKTTTIKMLCGLVIPDAGTVRLNGHDLARERGAALRQIGAVLEGTRNVYWRLSAWQNLMYFGRLKGQPGKAIKARAEHLLRDLDLWDRRGDRVAEFSRGMQQKVAIACALIADPPIVLLDEPTLGLDVQAARTVKAWVARLARDEGKTVVLTTHQLDLAQELCAHVNIMHRGRLVADHSLEDLLALYRQDRYEVRADGRLDSRPGWADGLDVRSEGDQTVISGIEDQDRLHAVIAGLRAMGAPLAGVQRIEPDLESVFVALVEGQQPISAADGPGKNPAPAR